MAEEIRGLNIKLGLDASSLEASLKSVKAELKEQQRDLSAINANLKYDPTNVDLWKQKQEKLNQILETTKSKLASQNAELEEAKKDVQIGAMSEEQFGKLQRGVQYTEADIRKLNVQLGQTKEKISALSGIDFAGLEKIGSGLTKFVTLPIAGAVTALGTLAYKTSDTVDDIGDTAKKLGVTVEALQKYEYVAKLMGTSTEAMDKAFQKTNSVLGDIASGNTSSLSESLGLIGLTVDDLAGLDTEAAFGKIRDALSQCGDSATRTAAAEAIFGDKIASELMPVLSATSEEVDGLKGECDDLGVVSTEQAEIAGSFQDAVDRLKTSLKALAMELSAAVLPVMEKIVDFIREQMIPRISKLIEWWAGLSSSMKKVIAVSAAFLASAGPIVSVISKIALALPKIKASVSAVGAALKAVSSGVSAAKLGWGALIAIIAVILLQNEKFRELLGEVLSLVSTVIGKIVALVQRLFEELKPVLDAVMAALNAIIDVLVGLVSDTLDAVIDVVGVVLGLLQSLMPFVEKIINMLTELLVPILNLIKAVLTPIAEIIKVVIGLVVQVVEAVIELIDSVLSAIIDVLTVICDVLEQVVDIIVVVIDLVVSILQPILEIIIQLLQPIFSLIGVIIEVVSMLMEILKPLIETLLQPILVILTAVGGLLERFSPVLEMIANVVKTLIMPVLQIVYKLLEPILAIINAIIEAIQWVIDKVSGPFSWLVDLFTGGGSSIDGGTVSNSSSTSNSYSNNETTNNVTINTSADVDADSINKALGGAY